VVFLSGAEELRKAVQVLTGLKYPQSFPDAAPARVIRKAVFSCSIYSKNCTLVFMLPTDAAVSRSFPTQASTDELSRKHRRHLTLFSLRVSEA